METANTETIEIPTPSKLRYEEQDTHTHSSECDHGHSQQYINPYPKMEIPMTFFKKNRIKFVKKMLNESNTKTPVFTSTSRPLPNKSMIIFEGGVSSLRHDTDHENLFRQNSHFHYLFGAKEPDFFASIEINNENNNEEKDNTDDEDILQSFKTTLYMPRLPEEYSIWMGKLLSCDDFRELYEVDEVKYTDELINNINLYNPDLILYNYGLNTDSGNYPELPKINNIEQYEIDQNMVYPILCECRVIKEEHELELLKYVNDISSNAHFEVMRRTCPGMYEYQLESTFLHYCYFTGNGRVSPYTCICGAGENSAILHYGHAAAPNSKLINPNDMLLLDMGCEVYCYGSDITCSFPANGKFNEKQKVIFNLVKDIQFNVMDIMKDGTSWVDCHTLAYYTIAQRFLEIGIFQGNLNDIMEANVPAYFMPHGLGHFLGIDTHDVGGYLEHCPEKDTERIGYKSLRTSRILKKGMVITVEPGVYFIEKLMNDARENESISSFINWDILEEWRDFGGVRLEDNVIIQENNIYNMTKCPRTVEDIEKVMSGEITDINDLFKKY